MSKRIMGVIAVTLVPLGLIVGLVILLTREGPIGGSGDGSADATSDFDLDVYCLADPSDESHEARLLDNDILARCPPGGALTFTYANRTGEPRHVVVYAMDPGGRVVWMAPRRKQGRSVPAPPTPSGMSPLKLAFPLHPEQSTGIMQVIAGFTREPLPASQVWRHDGQAPPDGAVYVTRDIVIESRPGSAP